MFGDVARSCQSEAGRQRLGVSAADAKSGSRVQGRAVVPGKQGYGRAGRKKQVIIKIMLVSQERMGKRVEVM